MVKKSLNVFLSFLFFVTSWGVFGQKDALSSKGLIESRIEQGIKFKSIDPYKRDITSSVESDFFSVKNKSLDILKSGQKDILFRIPSEILNHPEILLTKVNPLDERFYFMTSDGQKMVPDDAFFYRGIIKGKENTKVTLTVRGDFIRAHIISEDESYILGQFNQRKDKFVLMDEKYFVTEKELVCGWTEDLKGNNTLNIPLANENSRISASATSKTVKIFFETDYNLHQKLGNSVTNTQNYILSIFNEVASVYSAIGVSLNLSSSYIWTTTDPYASKTSTSEMLYLFRDTRTDFEGDLAHFLSGRSLGGIAWLGALCGSNNYAVSGSQGGDPTSLPRTSFTLIVVAHELGHNLGSQHTHSCAWNGNNTRIDDCGGDAGYSEGSCTNPTNPFLPARGTIMSYCHLRSIGSYFEFHPQVATRVYNYINSQTCLDCNSITAGSVCSSAFSISTTGTYTAPGPGCGNGCYNCGQAKHATWYKFLAPSDGKISILSCNQGVDSRLWVYRGNCGSFNVVGQSDDNCTINGSVSNNWAAKVENIEVSGNQWYYWEWDNRWSSSGFDFEFEFIPESNPILPCTFQNPNYSASSLNSGNYGTHENITSSAIISSGSSVQMSATQTITLKPGFQVQAGATFSARIENCTPSAITIPPQSEISIIEDMVVYPNPFQGSFTVKFSLVDKERGNLIVTNLQGQQMLNRRIDNNWGQNTYEEVFTFDFLVPGIYILSLRTDQRNIYKKIIKAE